MGAGQPLVAGLQPAHHTSFVNYLFLLRQDLPNQDYITRVQLEWLAQGADRFLSLEASSTLGRRGAGVLGSPKVDGLVPDDLGGSGRRILFLQAEIPVELVQHLVEESPDFFLILLHLSSIIMINRILFHRSAGAHLYLMILRVARNMFSTTKTIPLPHGLQMKVDPYRSMHFSMEGPMPLEPLRDYIAKLVQLQEQQNAKVSPAEETNAIWVHLEKQNLSHVGYFCSQGFTIHHGLGQELSLYKWISSKSPLIPFYAPFVVSCGAAIIHEGRILLVQEKNGARKGKWGLPGGRADVGESLQECCERQLVEQTGIKAKFKSLLYFRELPMPQTKHMDIYFVCLMKYEPDFLSTLKLCERELSDHKWIPLEEYHQFVKENADGTQLKVGEYINNLALKKFDFENGLTPDSIGYSYTSPRDHITRYVIEHHLAKM